MLPKLGILAGGGDLPARLIEACRSADRSFFVVAIDDQTDPTVVADTPHFWVRLGAAGEAIERLRQENVEELVLSGRIRRPGMASLRPDGWTARFFAKAGIKAFGDDGLLKALIAELENEGFRVIGQESLLAELIAPEGVYGTIAPDETARDDITRGIEVARGIGALDVGQGAVVQQGLVLAVEAIGGTDEMLSRAAALRREGPGGVLVKVVKPGQESRADLPTVGVQTVEKAHRAGLRGIAVQAGGALIVDRDAVVESADAKEMFLIGVSVRDT